MGVAKVAVNYLMASCLQIDFEIAAAVSSSFMRDFTDEGFSDFSDLSDGESNQDQEPLTIAKLKLDSGHCGK